MMSVDKMQCLECSENALCPSDTRVYVNYCGSMPDSLKDDIYRAKVECRMRRRRLRYRGLSEGSCISVGVVTVNLTAVPCSI
jgi:hypothetical protein